MNSLASVALFIQSAQEYHLRKKCKPSCCSAALLKLMSEIGSTCGEYSESIPITTTGENYDVSRNSIWVKMLLGRFTVQTSSGAVTISSYVRFKQRRTSPLIMICKFISLFLCVFYFSNVYVLILLNRAIHKTIIQTAYGIKFEKDDDEASLHARYSALRHNKLTYLFSDFANVVKDGRSS